MKYLIILSVFLFSGLRADWNEKFDKQSEFLIEQIKEFQGEYKSLYKSFAKMKKNILKDYLLYKQIDQAPKQRKMILLRPRDGFVVKKRANNNIHELIAWEMSYLLGGSGFVMPSYPVEVAGKRVVIQKMEPFTFKSEKILEELPKEIKRVTPEEYWKAHIQAYLLGLGDLVGQNIGVTPLSHIRFFDAESCFNYVNITQRTIRSFRPGFYSQSLEWPQYRQALDAKAVSNLQKFIGSMSSLEENLEKYLSCRTTPINPEGLLFRLEKVRTFPLEEGTTFRDFYGFLYPEIDEGLDELSALASEILERKVDHGSALVLVCRWIDKYNVSSKHRQAVEDWMTKYLGEKKEEEPCE